MSSKRRTPTPPTNNLSEFVNRMSPCPGAKPGAQQDMPLTSQLMAHVCLLNSVLERAGDRTTSQYGLTMAQWFALGCVGHAGESGVTHSELGKRLLLSKAPITGVVDRLERSGFVVREADGHDRRVSRVKITSKGMETWLTVRGSLRELAETICEGLNDQQLREGQSLMIKLLENASRTDPTLSGEKVGDKE